MAMRLINNRIMCRNLLVDQFVEAKRTKEEELVADVHSLSAGDLLHVYITATCTLCEVSNIIELCGHRLNFTLHRVEGVHNDVHCQGAEHLQRELWRPWLCSGEPSRCFAQRPRYIPDL